MQKPLLMQWVSCALSAIGGNDGNTEAELVIDWLSIQGRRPPLVEIPEI